MPAPAKAFLPLLRAALSRPLQLTVAVAAFCMTPIADGQFGIVHRDAGVDDSIHPGDDFFAYANGGWLRSVQFPAGKVRWTARDEIDQKTRLQVLSLLDDAEQAPAGSLARKVGDFRAAIRNSTGRNPTNDIPKALAPQLDRIAAITNRSSLARHLGATMDADVDPLNAGKYVSARPVGLAVQTGIDGGTHPLAVLVQGGLGLPDRADYLSDTAEAKGARNHYRITLAEILHAVAPERSRDSTDRAAAVLALETALARSHAPSAESDRETNAGNTWRRDEFAVRAPGMDWRAFFEGAGLNAQHALVAWQPGALTGLAVLVKEQPLDAWKDYLRGRLLAGQAHALPGKYAGLRPGVHGTQVRKAQEPPGEAATDITLALLGDAVGRLYAERHFPAEHKARVREIVTNVATAFAKRVDAASWMSPSSKSIARQKLATMKFGVGYPDRWPDLSRLEIKAADPIGNVLRLSRFRCQQALARLGKAEDPEAWAVDAHWPGAVLLFHRNAYNFAAALLQMPKFDAEMPDAMAYGAIGAIAGHEISHFVDTLGAEYEATGRLAHWWNDEDRKGFEAASLPLVRQYSSYALAPGIFVDGKRTLTENTADLGGLMAAFDAHRKRLTDRAVDENELRAQDRLFFMGYARGWRAAYRDDGLKRQANAAHAPETYRVATVRNLDAWYDAFDVNPGARLYLEPKARVRIW